MAYTAVRTTGIYCRPGCPARPLERNTETYTSAAAAEAAGYRPCLRCRPWRSDHTEAVTGPELSCRAVAMVVDGALDGATEADLAARLGVSTRHLRRLFAEHVGVTPDGLARSRRTHFARRLLDDTDLPVVDVAAAAGFGSVRQLRRACNDTFGAPPLELRARRRRADRLVADGGLEVRIDTGAHGCSAAEWAAACRYVADRAVERVESVAPAEPGSSGVPVWRRTMEVAGQPGVWELHHDGDHGLVARLHLPHWEGLIHIVERIRGALGLHDGAVVDPARGCWDPFEECLRGVAGHHMQWMVAQLGTPVPGLGPFGLDRLFPGADVVATGDLGGLPPRRAGAVRALAAAVADGSLRLEGGLEGVGQSDGPAA